MGSAFAVPCVENKNDVTIVGTHLENELIENINSNWDEYSLFPLMENAIALVEVVPWSIASIAFII